LHTIHRCWGQRSPITGPQMLGSAFPEIEYVKWYCMWIADHFAHFQTYIMGGVPTYAKLLWCVWSFWSQNTVNIGVFSRYWMEGHRIHVADISFILCRMIFIWMEWIPLSSFFGQLWENAGSVESFPMKNERWHIWVVIPRQQCIKSGSCIKFASPIFGLSFVVVRLSQLLHIRFRQLPCNTTRSQMLGCGITVILY
jgi:hypothetical protein